MLQLLWKKLVRFPSAIAGSTGMPTHWVTTDTNPNIGIWMLRPCCLNVALLAGPWQHSCAHELDCMRKPPSLKIIKHQDFQHQAHESHLSGIWDLWCPWLARFTCSKSQHRTAEQKHRHKTEHLLKNLEAPLPEECFTKLSRYLAWASAWWMLQQAFQAPSLSQLEPLRVSLLGFREHLGPQACRISTETGLRHTDCRAKLWSFRPEPPNRNTVRVVGYSDGPGHPSFPGGRLHTAVFLLGGEACTLEAFQLL